MPGTNAPDTSTIFATSISQLSLATGIAACANAMPAASLHSSVTSNAPAMVVHAGAVISVIVMTCVYTSEILPHASVTVHVLVYVPSCGHVPGTNVPATSTISATSTSQLSVAPGIAACAKAMPAASLHSSVTSNAPAMVVHVGAVLSVMVITCVYTSEILPHASVTVHVLVYVPSCGQVIPGTNAPATSTIFATSTSQLSLATGIAACANAMPAASLHSSVTSNAPAMVVHVGAVLSVTVITCVYTAEILPHASVTVHVLVYVPS